MLVSRCVRDRQGLADFISLLKTNGASLSLRNLQYVRILLPFGKASTRLRMTIFKVLRLTLDFLPRKFDVCRKPLSEDSIYVEAPYPVSIFSVIKSIISAIFFLVIHELK